MRSSPRPQGTMALDLLHVGTERCSEWTIERPGSTQAMVARTPLDNGMFEVPNRFIATTVATPRRTQPLTTTFLDAGLNPSGFGFRI